MRSTLFINRNMTLLLTGKVFSVFGDNIYAFALGWYILKVTGSGLQMGAFLAVEMFTQAVFSLFGGVFADRLNRKWLLVWMDLLRWIAVLAAAAALYFQPGTIWPLYAAAVALGFCSGLFNPASNAIIPAIVKPKELTQALSLNQTVSSVGSVAGIVLSGFLYQWFGITGVFIINGCTFLVSGIVTGCIGYRRRSGGRRISVSIWQSVWRMLSDLTDGMAYIRTSRLTMSLLILYILYFSLVMPLGFIYFPYIFNVILKTEPYQLALAINTITVGFAVAPFIVTNYLKKYSVRDAIFWSLCILAMIQVLSTVLLFSPVHNVLSNWHTTIIFGVISIFLGVLLTFFQLPVNIILQKSTPDKFRGRFWGVFNALISFSVPVIYLLSGIFCRYIPMPVIFLATGLGLFLVGCWVSNFRELKALSA